jgi:ArsR family transcriptional regulator
LTNVDILAILGAMKQLPQIDVQALAGQPASGDCCGEVDSGARYYPETADAARLFHALADETRLAILKQLRDEGEVCACDFRACCRLAQPTVSHHLKVLREAGLVTAEKRGLWVHYQLNKATVERLRAFLP